MVAVPDPHSDLAHLRREPPSGPAASGPAASGPASSGASPGVPRLLDMLGIAAVAGGGLAGVLLLVESPFDGPWRVVLAVAVVFTGIYAGFLMIGFAANLRELEAVRRCLALVARRQRPHGH